MHTLDDALNIDFIFANEAGVTHRRRRQRPSIHWILCYAFRSSIYLFIYFIFTFVEGEDHNGWLHSAAIAAAAAASVVRFTMEWKWFRAINGIAKMFVIVY